MFLNSPIGRILLAADEDGICEIRLDESGAEWETGGNCPLLERAADQLGEYFAGFRRDFDLPLSVHGSAFEEEVWRELKTIPFGETRTYGQLAAKMGKAKSARAVGGACARNPLLIIVPCHRVIASSGALTGFVAGMQAKKMLLELEGHTVRKDRMLE